MVSLAPPRARTMGGGALRARRSKRTRFGRRPTHKRLAGSVDCHRLVFAVLLHTWAMEAWRQGMDLRTATTNLIYSRTLRISKSVLGTTTTGHVITMCSADCERPAKARAKSPSKWGQSPC